MKITAIVPAASLNGLYKLSIDGNFVGKISADDIIDLKLVINREVNEELHLLITILVDFQKYYQKALTRASNRLYSSYEIKQYLLSRGCNEDVASRIILRLLNLGIIDELRLCETFITNSMEYKPISQKSILNKLKQKRIPNSIIQASFEKINYDNELALDKMIAKKTKQQSYLNDKNKLFRYLVANSLS